MSARRIAAARMRAMREESIGTANRAAGRGRTMLTVVAERLVVDWTAGKSDFARSGLRPPPTPRSGERGGEGDRTREGACRSRPPHPILAFRENRPRSGFGAGVLRGGER